MTVRAAPAGTIRAFLGRDARVAMSYRAPFVLDVLAAGFAMVSLSYLGRIVDDGRVPGSYFEFAVIGFAILGFLQAGISVVAANFRQEQVQGTLEALLSTGISAGGLASGIAAYPMVSATIRVAVYTGVAALLGAQVSEGNWALAAAAMGLGALSFAGLGLVAAALVLTLRQAGAAVGFVVTLLGLAGGAIFPAQLLPDWARALAQASPVTHALAVVRSALLEQGSWRGNSGRLAALAGLAVAALAIGLAALTLALRRARRRGTIAGY